MSRMPTEQHNPQVTKPKWTLWDKLCRFQITRSRRSRRRLDEFVSPYATDERVLVVHSPDLDHRQLFPNAYVISSRQSRPADLHTDRYYTGLDQVPDASYSLIICTGLLEHLPEPAEVIAQLHRILKPGGRLIVSASAVFAHHGTPHNFFHFTPHGFEHLFRDWAGFDKLQGSTRPFESLAIQLQRINLQCDVFPPARLVIELLQHTLPLLDVFVLREYSNKADHSKPSGPGSVMPVTVHAVVKR